MSGGAAAAQPVAAPPPEAEPGRWRRHRVAIAFLAPAVILLGVWIVYPTVYTIVRSFYDREGSNFIGFDNYQELFSQDTLTTAIRNNVLWLAIVPALVASIGLMFAVLLERVRWSVAFKTVVFMPMAISLFAAGVIWRVMDEKDPEIGAVNAAIKVVADEVDPAGALSEATTVERPAHRQRGAGPHAAAPGRARRHGAARPHRHPAERGSRRGSAGARAAGRSGRDHRRRVARLQARRRQARRGGARGARPARRDRGAARARRREHRQDGDPRRRELRLRQTSRRRTRGSRSARRRSRSRSRASHGWARP